MTTTSPSFSTSTSDSLQAAGSEQSRLDRHYEDFRELLAVTRQHLSRGRPGSAAAYAQVAGQLVWMNHTGLFREAPNSRRCFWS